MPQGFEIQIPNLPKVTGMIRGLVSDLKNKIDNEVLAAGVQIRNKAIRNITQQRIVDQGALRAGMQLTHLNGKVQLFNTALYSPFIEFGTKGRTKVPPEWEAYARSFEGVKRGNMTQFENNMVAWIKRKGIRPRKGQSVENLARWYMMLILKNGLKPRPFMYPAYREEADALPDRVLKLIMREMVLK